MSRLDVNSGETYNVNAGETEEWLGADVDGTLNVNGTLKLIDDPDVPEAEFEPRVDPIDLPVSQINFLQMDIGLSVFLVGFLALLLGAAAFLRNYAAGIMWSMALIALIVSGLLNIGLELFWATVSGTIILLIMGMIVRWTG